MNPHYQAIEDARRAGIDMDLLDTNLALAVDERWRQHDGALALLLELEQARIQRDARLSPTVQRLADGGLEFVIVGGYAALTHGSSFVTRDLDICTALTVENLAKLRSLLADWHPKHRMTPQRLSFLDHPPAGVSLQNLYLETDVGVVDVLSQILGVGDFDRLFGHAESLEVEGRKYRLMSLEDLIASKEALGREKDLLAAKELRAIAAKRARC